MLPTAKAVSSATGTLRATSARPLTPVQLVPSRKTIVAETPGIPRRARRRSSWAWSRVPIGVVVRRGLAIALPSGAGAGGFGADGGLPEASADADGDGPVEAVARADADVAGDGVITAGVGTAAARGDARAAVAAPATATAAQPPSSTVSPTATRRPARRDRRGLVAGSTGSSVEAAASSPGRGSG